MGGAVGHLHHLYDNPDLTFGEIKEILKAASAGKLEKVSEKLDGLNLVFTWDESGAGLRAARNSGDIKSGGMDASALAVKFADRGNLSDAFNIAFKVLNQALGALPPDARTKIFGPDGRYWYSMELIYSNNPNVIQYDGNNVVFHGWPVFKAMPDGSVEKGPGGGADILVKYLEQMQASVKEKDWKVRGPALVTLKKLADNSIAQKALSKISSAMSTAKVSDADTVGDYIENFIEMDARQSGFPPPIASMIAARLAGRPGAPNLNDIKKKLDKSSISKLQEYAKAGPRVLKSAIAPIESAIHEFATEVLRGLESSLISRSDVEVDRLRAEVRKAADAIKSSGSEQAMTLLQTQLQKLGAYDNLATPMEGVVFIHNGNAYKFTGAFAPVNQILGLFKYGRGKMKIASENKMMGLVGDLVNEHYVSMLNEDEEDYYQKENEDAKKRYNDAILAIEAWKTVRAKKDARDSFLKNAGFDLGNKTHQDRARRRLIKDPKFKSDLEKAIAGAKSEKISDIEVTKDLRDELALASKKYMLFNPEEFGFKRQQKAAPAPEEKESFSSKPKMSIDNIGQEWIPWPNDRKLPSYGSARKEKSSEASATERADVGVGPGEERLAYVFGGVVKGGGVSYDVVTQDGRKWEVKALESASELIRPGTEGKAAISQTRDKLSSIMKQLRSFVAIAIKPEAFDTFKESHKQIINYTKDFVTTEYEDIVGKGEITDERFKDFYSVLRLVSRMQREVSAETKDIPTMVSLNDKKIKVDKPTFLDISKLVKKSTGQKEILEPFKIQEIVFSVLKDSAFTDVNMFFKDLFSSIKASSVFRGVDGVFIVNSSKGFYMVPKDQFDSAFKFSKISQATPRFKFMNF